MKHERTKEELEAWAELLATCVWRLLDGGPEVRPTCRRAFEGYVTNDKDVLTGTVDVEATPRPEAPAEETTLAAIRTAQRQLLSEYS